MREKFPPGFKIGQWYFIRVYDIDMTATFRAPTSELFSYEELQALAEHWGEELLPWKPHATQYHRV